MKCPGRRIAHRWGKWVVVEVGAVDYNGKVIEGRRDARQERSCALCGLTQRRELSI